MHGAQLLKSTSEPISACIEFGSEFILEMRISEDEVCMCVCICVCIYLSMYTCMYVYVCVHVCFIYVCMCLSACGNHRHAPGRGGMTIYRNGYIQE
jgi:hypothetical protein